MVGATSDVVVLVVRVAGGVLSTKVQLGSRLRAARLTRMAIVDFILDMLLVGSVVVCSKQFKCD